MTRINKTALAILIFGIGAMVGVPAQANECSRVNQLATDIHEKTRLLNRELVHYRHVPEYQCLKRETREVRRLAARIRGWSHNLRNLHRICEDLVELDASFHRLEGAFDAVELAAAQGFGHIECDTRHVKVLLRDTSACIHAMRREVRRLNRVAVRGHGHFDGHRDQRHYTGRSPYSGRPPYAGHSTYGSYSVHRGHGLERPAARGYQAPVVVDPLNRGRAGYYQIGRGIQLDGNGITLGRGNMNFRINF